MSVSSRRRVCISAPSCFGLRFMRFCAAATHSTNVSQPPVSFKCFCTVMAQRIYVPPLPSA